MGLYNPHSAVLVIAQQSERLRESGLLDVCAPQILRCAQDDKIPRCHPERSEGSLADVWVITRQKYALLSPLAFWRYLNRHMMYNKLDNTSNKKANR